ncbi:MAG TPA: hypothetical protein VD929_01890 [Caulobacteraceae bacterium]|nr:hypothetical protein [Caulobacteraceae bacterium]
MNRALLILGLSAALSACGVLRDVASPPAAGAPDPQAGRDWIYAADGGTGRLAFGTPQSDDVALMMSCAQGSGRVTVQANLPQELAGSPPKLTLVSGSTRATFLASAEASQLEAGNVFLTAQTRARDPVLVAFRRNGWIGISRGDTTDRFAPQPGTSAVGQFFAYCG